jgi:hypothetical protein
MGKSEKEAEAQAEAEADKFIEAEQKKAEASEKKKAKEIHAVLEKARAPSTGKIGLVLKLARLVLGIVMLAAGGALLAQSRGIPVPAFVMEYVAKYRALGAAGHVGGVRASGDLLYMAAQLLAGALLIVTVLSSRFLGPLLTLAGSVLVAANQAIATAADNPLANANLIWLVGLGAAAGGVVLCFLGKVGKGRF